MMGGITLAPLKTKIELELQSFKTKMNEAARMGVSAAQDMSSKMSKAADVGKTLEKAGGTMTKAFTVPLAGAGAACTKFYMDAEGSFGKVNTIMDSTKVSNKQLHDGVKKASNDSGVAITDFNEALYSSISAGVDSGKAIQFTTEMTKLAKGGFTSTESAVDVVTTALNAYGLGADQATSVSDKLITTQNLGKTTVDDLASSMGRVIPTANTYGVNLDNVCTSLADLTKNGIDTAEATTYYNSMLNELGSSGTKASEVIKEKMGGSFTELMNQGVPLTDVLKVLKDSAEESGMSLGDMFGSSEAAKAALTIMKDDGAEYNDILGQMESSAGATNDAYKKMDQTPLEQLKNALNELKNAAIDFGGQMAPAIKIVTDLLKDLGDKFQSLSPEQQKFIITAGLIVMALGPLLSAVGTGVTIFTQLAPVVSGAGAAISSAGGIMALLTGPVGIAVAAVVGLVAIGVTLYKNWDTIKEKAGQMKDWVVEKFENMKQGASDKIENLKTAATEKFEALKNGVRDKADSAKTAVTTKMSEMKEQVTGKIEQMKNGATTKFESFKSSASEKFEATKNSMTSLMETAKGNVQTKLNNMKKAFDDNGGGIKGAASAAYTGIKDIVNSNMSTINTLTGGKLEKIRNSFSDKLSSAKSTVSSILSGIKDSFSDKMDSARDIVSNAINRIKGFFKFSWSLPHLKLPHPYISGSFSLNPPSVPHFGIDWYKKGGIMTEPMIFGMSGSRFLGGGEAGQEAILPLDDFYSRLSRMLNEKTQSIGNVLNVNIDKFENNRGQDVQAFAEELEFYRKQLSKGGGVKTYA